MTPIRYIRVSTLRSKLALGAASGLILGASVGVAIYAGFGQRTPTASAGIVGMVSAAAGGGCDAGSRPAIGNYPADSNGDGIISDSGSERIPALIAAVADNGVSGYVKYTDLFCQAAPASPAAALAAQASGQDTISVYASNGTTVVGSLTVSGSNSAGG